ncbi:unnamed protein product [Blepharisma stoltei]|uniref:Uncharacterized protein n=1 Tax=Blepharisma stoltei TaxID=1481888 RepID=A0AAU9JZP7_9CILI|nr:unnamed protein product [Blepharisma stoltei]
MVPISLLLGFLALSITHSHEDFYYKGDVKLILGVNDMKSLVQSGELTISKAMEIWESLVKRAEEADTIYNPETQGDDTYYLFGIIPVLSIFYGIGSYAILGLFAGTMSTCYSNRSAVSLCLSSLFFAFLLYMGGTILYENTGSGLISSILLIACCLSWAMFLHSILIFLKYSDMEPEIETFNIEHNIGVKAFTAIFISWVSYILSFCCPFPLVQLPFYIGIAYIGYLIGLKLHPKMPLRLQPFWCVFVLLYSGIILAYLYLAGDRAFLYKDDYESMDRKVDFRLVGYIFNGALISVLLPVLVYVNYFGEYEEFKRDYLNFVLINDKIAQNPGGYRNWCTKDMLVLGLMIFYIFLSFFGFKQRVWCLVIYGYAGISIGTSFLPRTNSFFPDRALYTAILLFQVIVSSFLNNIEDTFSPQIISFFPDTIVWPFLSTIVRTLLAVVAVFNLYSSNLFPLSNPLAKDENSPSQTWIEYVLSFFTRYLLNIILILLVEDESSWLVSLVYNLAIVYCNHIPLDYSGSESTTDKIMRNSIVFLFGLRLSIMAQSVYLAFYIGIWMMGVSFYRYIMEEKMNFEFYSALFCYCGILIVYSVCIKSYIACFVGLGFFYIAITKALKIERWEIIGGAALIITILLFGICAIWVEPLFITIEGFFTQYQLGKSLYYSLSNAEIFVPEKGLISEVLLHLRLFISL